MPTPKNSEKKVILVVSDLAENLAKLTRRFEGTEDEFSVLVLKDISSCLEVSVNMSPDLIMLNFEEGDSTVSEILSTSKVPVMFLVNEESTLLSRWKKNKFTSIYSFDKIIDEDNFLQLVELTIDSLGDSLFSTEQSQDVLTYVEQLEEKNRELSSAILEVEQKNQALIKVKKSIEKELASVDAQMRTNFNSILSFLRNNINDKSHWANFKMYFEQMHPDFLKELKETYSVLTIDDLKYCAYLKMNMSNHEISHLLGINQESVRTHKYRLKKKMTLDKQVDLHQFISSFEYAN